MTAMNEKINNAAAVLGEHFWKVLLFGTFIWLALAAAGFGLRTAGLAGRTAKAIESYQSLDKSARETSAAGAKVSDEMRKKNPFASPARKQPPTCMGLLGDKAFIDGQWYRAGDTAGEVKIVAIGAKDVTVLWEGAEKKLVPFDMAVKYESSGGRPNEPPRPAGQAETPPGQAPAAPAQAIEQPGPPMGMTPEMIEKIRERFRNMSPEERRGRMRGGRD
jgi:hypothetical protein